VIIEIALVAGISMVFVLRQINHFLALHLRLQAVLPCVGTIIGVCLIRVCVDAYACRVTVVTGKNML